MVNKETEGEIYFQNVRELMKDNSEIENICPCCGLMTVEIWDICEICDWQNDVVQNSSPDYSGGANRESLNSYREKWLRTQNAKENGEQMDLKQCRCCGDFTIEEYDAEEICSTCAWHDEILQWEDPDYHGGPNGTSLNEYRKKWIASQTIRGVFIYHYKNREIFPLKIKWTEEQVKVLKKCNFSFDPFESMTEEEITDELRDNVFLYLCGCYDQNHKNITKEGVICDDIIDVICAIEAEFVDKFYVEESFNSC